MEDKVIFLKVANVNDEMIARYISQYINASINYISLITLITLHSLIFENHYLKDYTIYNLLNIHFYRTCH